MATLRRSNSNASDYEDADEADLGLISAADIENLRLELSEKCSAVNCSLLSSKEQVDKRRLIENIVQNHFSAFNRVAAAYDRLKTYNQALTDIKDAFKKSIREEALVTFLKMPPSSFPDHTSGRSFADVASRPAKQNRCKFKVSNGPTVTVPKTVSFVVGPKSDHASKFGSADDTRKAIMKAVNPTEVSLKVSRVVSVRSNSVRIIAEDADIEKIRSSPFLLAAGLEVKMKDKLNPRMIIRGVPTSLTSAELLKDIVSMNADTGCSEDNFKILYGYPPRDSRTASSVVIETNSDVRRGLLNQGRIYLSWQSCRIEDHLRVLQCYKCQSFGHLAKNCNADLVCGHCTGPHNTSSCPKNKSTPTCHNFSAAKLPLVDHRAFDAVKWPLLKLKLTEKAKNISY